MKIFIPHLHLEIEDGMHIELFNGHFKDQGYSDRYLIKNLYLRPCGSLGCIPPPGQSICQECTGYVIEFTYARSRTGYKILCLSTNVKEIRIIPSYSCVINKVTEV